MKESVLLMVSMFLAVLLAGGVALVATTQAEAAFPGTNGRIAFVSGRDGNYEIYTMGFGGDNVRRLTNTSWLVGDMDPAWSPDGRKIAFSRYRDNEKSDIYIMNADGSNQRLITRERSIPGPPKEDKQPAFSPDGRRIVFQRGRGYQIYDIYKINVDGSNLTPVVRSDRLEKDAAWSPNGRKIAFISGGKRIATVRPDGTGFTVLGPGFDPNWSPDGTQLTFARDNDMPDSEIFKMNADGTEVTQLTAPAGPDPDRGWGASSPAFSPGGGKIVFSDGRDGDQEIFTMNADGTDKIQLTQNTDYDFDPDWQPVR
jgi:TolB protein